MITKAYEAGVYTIITPSGTYYVDGVASTTYVAYIPYTVWRIFADGYIHLRYLLGAPIVASGEGVLPLFAQYELLEILSLPEPLMFMLWPLTLLTTVAAELVNKVLELSPAVLSTCATATTSASPTAPSPSAQATPFGSTAPLETCLFKAVTSTMLAPEAFASEKEAQVARRLPLRPGAWWSTTA